MDKRIFFSGLLIALGVVFLLGNFVPGFSAGWLIGTFWPVIIIALGIKLLFNSEPKHKIQGSMIITLGILFQINELEIIDLNFWSILWPVLLIFAGISLITNVQKRRYKLHKDHLFNDSCKKEEITEDDFVNVECVLSSVKKNLMTNEFKGGEITGVMGSVEIDMRRSTLSETGGILSLSTVMGNIELFLPQDWNIFVKTEVVLGNVENTTINKFDIDQPYIEIRASAVMGNIEIRN